MRFFSVAVSLATDREGREALESDERVLVSHLPQGLTQARLCLAFWLGSESNVLPELPGFAAQASTTTLLKLLSHRRLLLASLPVADLIPHL